MQLSGKKLTTAILAGLMGATMFGGSVFADDAQRLTNVEVLATQNKSNIDTLKNDVQALKDASTKDTYSKDEVDNKLADKANQSDVTTNTNGIATNKQAISDEATARQTADADLQKGVDANKQAISDEATARQTADAGLQKGVDANKQAIADETKARQTDVANLQTNIKDALTNQGIVNDTLTKAVQANSNAIVTSSQNLEKHLGETDGRVDKANQQINTNKGDIAQNKADIATNKTDIATNKADIAQNKVDIAQNKTDIATNKTDIATNKADIAQNKTDIATNKTDIATNKKAINDEAATRQAADQNLQNQINNNSTSINDLYGRYSSLKTDINKVGARSAALAGLHPLDFDPANKLNFAVASGSFKGENSVALGAFYRPNENIMFSAASTMGDSDNAYTFGLSFKIGPSSAKTKTTSPDAEELYKVVGELQDQLAAQQKEIEQLKANKAK